MRKLQPIHKSWFDVDGDGATARVADFKTGSYKSGHNSHKTKLLWFLPIFALSALLGAGRMAWMPSVSADGDISTFDALKSAVSSATDGDTINVTADIDITGTIEIAKKLTISSSNGSSLKRKACAEDVADCAAFTGGSLLKVTSAGELTLTNITLDGQQVSVDGGKTSPYSSDAVNLVHVEGGKLNIADGAVLTGQNSSNGQKYQYNATVLVNGGALNMSGGKITGNQTGAKSDGSFISSFGGGVTVLGTDDVAGQFTFSGGEISGNSAYNGGGIYLGAGASLTMTGGTITGNTAGGYGGGIYVYSGATASISAGYITYNTAGNAAFGGGGIYVNSAYTPITGTGLDAGQLHLYNADISYNETTYTGVDEEGNPVTAADLGYDSAIATCETGGLEINVTAGAVIHDNATTHEIIAHVSESSGTFFISPIMLGGGAYNWTDENGRVYDLDELAWRYDADAAGDSGSNWRYADSAVSAADGTATGLDRVTTFIQYNKAVLVGAAIGTNGAVQIGYDDGDVTINLEKKWDEELVSQLDNVPEAITVTVYATDSNGVTTAVGEVTLSAENDWKGTIEGLPKYDSDGAGKEYQYHLSENSDYFYAEIVSEKRADEDGDDSTDIYDVTITNKLSGSLAVSKTATGTGFSEGQEFTFTLTLSDTTVDGTYGDLEFADGVATFTLTDGETKTASPLPAGASFTVIEQDSDLYDVTITVDGEVLETATGIIPYNDLTEVAFANFYDAPEEPASPDAGTTSPNTGDLPVFSVLAVLSLAGTVLAVTFAITKRRV